MEKKDESVWQRNAPTQIILNSILAALDGILIPWAFDSLRRPYSYMVIALLVCSFFLFAVSAEQTLNAPDENDVRKYIYYMLWYNIGAILLGLSIALAIYVNFDVRTHGIAPWYVVVAYLVLFSFLFLHRWVKDSYWLLRERKTSFKDCIDELEDRRRPKQEVPMFMRWFYKSKGIRIRNAMPHDDVYTRLGPSKVHGVGVFAICDIPKGTFVSIVSESVKRFRRNRAECRVDVKS